MEHIYYQSSQSGKMKYLLSALLATLYSYNPEPIVVIEDLTVASTHQAMIIQTPELTILWIEQQ